MEAAGGITHRWNMGAEARALVILTGVLLAFGLATVYSASAIVEMQAGYGHARLLVRQLAGMGVGALLFTIAARMDGEVWERLAWPIMIASLMAYSVVLAKVLRSPARDARRIGRYVRAVADTLPVGT